MALLFAQWLALHGEAEAGSANHAITREFC
jgi:hypothetical protein